MKTVFLIAFLTLANPAVAQAVVGEIILFDRYAGLSTSQHGAIKELLFSHESVDYKYQTARRKSQCDYKELCGSKGDSDSTPREKRRAMIVSFFKKIWSFFS
jgi:hypothetical protein